MFTIEALGVGEPALSANSLSADQDCEPPMKFSNRDLLLLTVIVALAVGEL